LVDSLESATDCLSSSDDSEGNEKASRGWQMLSKAAFGVVIVGEGKSLTTKISPCSRDESLLGNRL
jgi:hypothetical protein